MVRLVNTDVMHRTGDITVVDFDTDEGRVVIEEIDGEVVAEVARQEVSAAEARKTLEAVEDSEYFDDAAAETAHDLLDQLADQSSDEEDEDEQSENQATEEDAEVVHVTDDGTEVRVGDKVNHPGGWSYEVVGRESDHTVEKLDPIDDNTQVTISTLESDIEDQGFAERAEGGC